MQVIKLLEIIVVGSIQLLQDKVHLLTSIQINEYKDKNFTIVGISLDKDKSKWMKAIADDNLAWTHLSDLKYWDSEIPALYGVRGIPANVLLDPDGVIVAKNITGEDLHKKLKEVIK